MTDKTTNTEEQPVEIPETLLEQIAGGPTAVENVLAIGQLTPQTNLLARGIIAVNGGH